MVNKKYKELKRYLKTKLIKDKPVSILNYKDLLKGEKEIWTTAINKALEENACIYIPKGKYFIDSSIIVPSNRRIIAHKDAEICTILSCKKVSLRTDCVIDGSYRVIGDDEPRTENVFIEGGVWSTEQTRRAEYGAVGAYDDVDSLHGVHACMLFSGVRNLWIKNVKFKHVSTFAIQVGRVENFIVEKIKFIECYADGVHINGQVKDGFVYDISGEAGDDLVALNAYDWPNSTITQGPIEDIVISKINSKGKDFNLMRILPGVTSCQNGNIDCYIKNIIIDNVKGVDTYKMYFQTSGYVGTPEGSAIGKMENITIKNLKILKTRPADGTPNYVNADPITGHFGVFELGSNVDGLTLENIKVQLKVQEKYKGLEHFIVVGPKSYYIPERNLEVFDPYVISKVKNLIYKNIKINGKKVENIMEHVKEIKFEKLYDSEYASGYGEIENTIKL